MEDDGDMYEEDDHIAKGSDEDEGEDIMENMEEYGNYLALIISLSVVTMKRSQSLICMKMKALIMKIKMSFLRMLVEKLKERWTKMPK